MATTPEIKVKVSTDTSGVDLGPAQKSLRDLQKESAQAKAELAKLQAEFQETKNKAVQAGTALDKTISDDFKKRIFQARTDVSRLNSELAQGVASGLGKSAASFDNFSSSAGGALTTISTQAGIAIGSIVALTASLAGLATRIDQIAGLQDVAEKIGDTATNVASLKLASDVSGVSLDTVAAASVKLTAALSKAGAESSAAAQALNAIGLSLEDFKKLAPVDQIDAVSKALKGFEDGASKTAVAVALFGKSGAELLPFLNDLNDGYERNNLLTEEQIKNADDFSKNIASLKNEFSALSLVTTAEIIPSLSKMLEQFKSLLEFMGALNKDGTIFQSVMKVIGTVFETIIVLGSDVVFVFKGIYKEITGIASQVVALSKLDLKGFSAISDAMKSDAKKARAELDKFQYELGNGLTSKGRSADPNDPRLIGKAPASETAGAKKALNFQQQKDPKEVQLRADLANKESEAQKQSLNEFRFISDEYRRLYSQNLISIQAYYDQQQELIEKQRVADNEAFLARQQQLEAEKARLQKGGADPKEVLKVEEALQKAVTENQAKQLGYVTQLRGIEDSRVTAATKFNAELGKINQQFLEIQGLGATAEAQELRRLDIARQYEEQLKRIRAEKGDNSAEEAQVLAIQRQLAATQELAAAQSALKQSQTENSLEQLAIQEQLNRGTISQVEAQVRMNELKAIAIEQEIALQQAATQNLNLSTAQRNEAAIKVAELQAALASLQPQLTDFGTQFQTLFQDRIGSALGDVLTRTKSFKDAFKSLIAGIAQDLIRSNISKLIASAFGGGLGGAGGGFLSSIGSALGFADGGKVTGPGTGTSDSIPARLSNGEFVMKASSVKKYGTEFMTAINEGVARFKNGGAVTNSRAPYVQKFAMGGPVQAGQAGDVNVQVINQSSQPVNARQERDPVTGFVQIFLSDMSRGGPMSRSINQITGTGRSAPGF